MEQEDDKLKIYISVDLEGINGVVTPEQVLPQYSAYEETRKIATDEVNAAISGVKEVGATKILVNDSHHCMTNIILSELDRGAELISGKSKRYSMVQGADESFDAAMFIGYHAKAGTTKAIMDHSFFPKELVDMRINGISYGEIGLNMLYIASMGVPTVMVTGDTAAVLEAITLNPSCRTVAVKEAQGRFSAKCMPIEKSLMLIKETAKEAISALKDIDILEVPRDPDLELDFVTAALADSAAVVPGSERVSSKTIRYRCKDIKELYMWRQVFCGLAVGAYNKDY